MLAKCSEGPSCRFAVLYAAHLAVKVPEGIKDGPLRGLNGDVEAHLLQAPFSLGLEGSFCSSAQVRSWLGRRAQCTSQCTGREERAAGMRMRAASRCEQKWASTHTAPTVAGVERVLVFIRMGSIQEIAGESAEMNEDDSSYSRWCSAAPVTCLHLLQSCRVRPVGQSGSSLDATSVEQVQNWRRQETWARATGQMLRRG